MTARKADTRKQSAEQKSLSLRKRTLRDLSARRDGPRGGFIMKDTIIIKTSGR